jgi:hypothetical protein
VTVDRATGGAGALDVVVAVEVPALEVLVAWVVVLVVSVVDVLVELDVVEYVVVAVERVSSGRAVQVAVFCTAPGTFAASGNAVQVECVSAVTSPSGSANACHAEPMSMAPPTNTIANRNAILRKDLSVGGVLVDMLFPLTWAAPGRSDCSDRGALPKYLRIRADEWSERKPLERDTWNFYPGARRMCE